MSDDFILEYLPDEVQATIEARDRALAALGSATGGLEFVVDDLRRWVPGSTVTVAFLGGSTELHRDIAEACAAISAACNLELDFGKKDDGTYRTWSTDDTDYAANIRVSFDQGGYFSLVGTDSVAPNIGPPGGPVGGRANQRSLNLGGFHVQRPATWKGTTLHEFLHALSFHHEHTNMRGPCQGDFRFDDDPGYVPTRDPRGVFVADSGGRRPGIYTYLSGAPNFWSRAKVDHNLRPSGQPVTEGSFDRASVMLYRFPELFYRTANTGCAPDGTGQELSAGDVAGLDHLYPGDPSQVVYKKKATLEGMRAAAPAPAADDGLEAVGDDGEHVLQGAIESLSRQVEGDDGGD